MYPEIKRETDRYINLIITRSNRLLFSKHKDFGRLLKKQTNKQNKTNSSSQGLRYRIIIFYTPQRAKFR